MAVKPKETYTRNAVVKRVVDGDTLELEIDLGMKIQIDVTCRMAGINAPEISTAAGKASKAWLEQQLPANTAVTVQTIKGSETEKYGRYLATVFKPGTSASVNEQAIAQGMAKSYMV